MNKMKREYKIVLVGDNNKQETVSRRDVLINGVSKEYNTRWKTDVYSMTLNTNFGEAKFEIWDLIDSSPWLERCWNIDGAIIIDFEGRNRYRSWGDQIVRIAGDISALYLIRSDASTHRIFSYIRTFKVDNDISTLLVMLYNLILIQELRDGKLISISEEG